MAKESLFIFVQMQRKCMLTFLGILIINKRLYDMYFIAKHMRALKYEEDLD